jgi:hypothetical protein
MPVPEIAALFIPCCPHYSTGPSHPYTDNLEEETLWLVDLCTINVASSTLDCHTSMPSPCRRANTMLPQGTTGEMMVDTLDWRYSIINKDIGDLPTDGKVVCMMRPYSLA